MLPSQIRCVKEPQALENLPLFYGSETLTTHFHHVLLTSRNNGLKSFITQAGQTGQVLS